MIGPPSGVNEMVSVEGGVQMDRGATSGNLIWNPYYSSIEGSGMTGATSTVKLPEAIVPSIMGKVAHIRVLMDSGYLGAGVRLRRRRCAHNDEGLGDTKPAAPNGSASGRAQNRRVEVVKQ